MTHHRPQPSEGCEEYLFLTPNGRRVTHLSEELSRLSRDFPTQHGVLKVSSTDMRKMSSTAVAATKDDATIRSVAMPQVLPKHTISMCMGVRTVCRRITPSTLCLQLRILQRIHPRKGDCGVTKKRMSSGCSSSCNRRKNRPP